MRLTRTAVPVLMLALASGGAFAHQPEGAPANIPASYEGGSLPLDHSKVKATLGADGVILVQRGRRISVPARSITEIACGTGVHRRMGAAVLDVVPYMHLGETKEHYVGVTWISETAPGSNAPNVAVLLKLNKGEYGAFVAGLERITGKKAVDTNRTLTSVRY